MEKGSSFREVTPKNKTVYLKAYLLVFVRVLIGLRPFFCFGFPCKPFVQVMNYFKLPMNAALVLADEVALDFGQLRLRSKGSPGGHNGLKSMEAQLKTQEYSRLKIGVGGDRWFRLSATYRRATSN